jgi:hybrid cluster-associated redox disulfide protein
MKRKAAEKSNVKSVKEPINSKMSFAEVMQKYPETAEVFFKHGMACFGCPAAMQESLEAGISAHGHDVKKIIDEINKAVKKQKRK